MDKTKKDFMPATPPPCWKLNPKYVECRTRRTQLLLAPNLHACIKAASEAASRRGGTAPSCGLAGPASRP
jgi:hypothetical protein